MISKRARHVQEKQTINEKKVEKKGRRKWRDESRHCIITAYTRQLERTVCLSLDSVDFYPTNQPTPTKSKRRD